MGIVRRGVLTVLAAGALAVGGLGVGTASAATITPEQAAPAPQATWWHGDYCDSYNRRFAPQCRYDRWNWDRRHNRWDHWRWDDRGHRWDHR